MEHRRPQVGQLVEQPDREVGDDERDVDDREAPRSQPVGERKHPSSLSPASPSGFTPAGDDQRCLSLLALVRHQLLRSAASGSCDHCERNGAQQRGSACEKEGCPARLRLPSPDT